MQCSTRGGELTCPPLSEGQAEMLADLLAWGCDPVRAEAVARSREWEPASAANERIRTATQAERNRRIIAREPLGALADWRP